MLEILTMHLKNAPQEAIFQGGGEKRLNFAKVEKIFKAELSHWDLLPQGIRPESASSLGQKHKQTNKQTQQTTKRRKTQYII